MTRSDLRQGVLTGVFLEPLQHHLASRGAAFDQGVRAHQVRRIDAAIVSSHCVNAGVKLGHAAA